MFALKKFACLDEKVLILDISTNYVYGEKCAIVQNQIMKPSRTEEEESNKTFSSKLIKMNVFQNNIIHTERLFRE